MTVGVTICVIVCIETRASNIDCIRDSNGARTRGVVSRGNRRGRGDRLSNRTIAATAGTDSHETMRERQEIDR